MAYNGHPVIDADSHIREYWDLDRTYTAYIDPEYRDQWNRFHAAVKGRQSRPGDVGFSELLWPRLPGHPMGVYDGFMAPPQEERPFDRSTSNAGRKIDPSCHWDPTVRLKDMDTAGVDKSVMFASQSDGFCMLDDIGFESALQRAYHRFMNHYCSEAEGRLFWVGNSNLRDIDESIRQLRYWHEHDPYFAGMFISRALPDGAMLDHPRLHPLFAASQELNMPIWVHGGSNRPPLTPWPGASNAVYHGWGGQYALAGLVGGGVFDLFPELRIGLFESGVGWMPWFIEKLDDGYRPGSAQTPYLKRSASEIAASGQLFVSIEADEEYIPEAVEALGEHLWLFATDYPHNGTCWPEGVPLVDGQKISEKAKLAMLGENALRFQPRLA
jgi:predicted TIM-barrel fold metal-dependent hydrolase